MMGGDGRFPGLEIDEDMRFQRRMWAVERVGWAGLALLVLAALLGVFSGGPLSSAEAPDPDGLIRVSWERFQRYGASSELHVELGAAATAGDEVELELRGPLVEAIHLRTVFPQPAEARMVENGWVLTFPVGQRGAPSDIQMELRPHALWSTEATFAVAGHAPLVVDVFVYP